MLRSRLTLLSMGIVLAAIVASGCKSVGRATQKATGTYDALLSGTPDKVVEAAKAALGELKIHVDSANATKLDGEILARTAQDKSITIKVTSEGQDVSRMTVKVGTVGDKKISKSILDETKKRL